MEKQHQTKTISHAVVITIIISLAIASFTLCIICELKKSKGIAGIFRFCRRRSFELMESYVFYREARHLAMESRSIDFKPARTLFPSILLLLSWMSFFIMVILTGTTTSMNRIQSYGEGWLDGKCYIVKNGVFAGSGVLVLIATSSILLSCYLMIKKSRPIHAQVK
ncbi:hypothetical protein CTI12_AA014120 [Artemisia annua]|uniref:Uncharacterized protein n=1 Tax=Artemisia annua TaxID=35608 RepID=A0A2U1QLS0_ARTAN|nr:hypothetical protein CTI12_AA014120 [Artemisia annua]